MSLNIPTPTGYSPFWQLTGDKVAYSMQIASGQHRAKDAWHISKWAKGYGTRDMQAAIAVLIGAVAGTTADARFTAVPNPAGPSAAVPQVTGVGDLGGLRTAVLGTGYNRTTSTPDVNELKRWFNTALRESGITYPTATGSTMARGAMHSGTPGFS